MATKEELIDLRKNWTAPKSICTCGHSGDGVNSSHADNITFGVYGHGRCYVTGCNCKKFTWAKFTALFEKLVEMTI